MAKSNVVDMNGQHAGEIKTFRRCVRYHPEREGCPHCSGELPGQPAPGYSEHQSAWKSPAAARSLGVEGHRPRSSGLHPRSAVDPRRRCSGPKPRSYNYHINNKVKRLALLSVLSDKAANGNMVVVDKFVCDEYKTKAIVAMLSAVGAGRRTCWSTRLSMQSSSRAPLTSPAPRPPLLAA